MHQLKESANDKIDGLKTPNENYNVKRLLFSVSNTGHFYARNLENYLIKSWIKIFNINIKLATKITNVALFPSTFR